MCAATFSNKRVNCVNVYASVEIPFINDKKKNGEKRRKDSENRRGELNRPASARICENHTHLNFSMSKSVVIALIKLCASKQSRRIRL